MSAYRTDNMDCLEVVLLFFSSLENKDLQSATVPVLAVPWRNTFQFVCVLVGLLSGGR